MLGMCGFASWGDVDAAVPRWQQGMLCGEVLDHPRTQQWMNNGWVLVAILKYLARVCSLRGVLIE